MTKTVIKSSKPASNVKRIAIDAIDPFQFVITSDAVCGATKGDPCNCVIARAVKIKLRQVGFGDVFLEGIEVGSTVTKFYVPGKVIRYKTPSVLQRALHHFDITGEWNLPAGSVYALQPMPNHDVAGARSKRSNSWKKTEEKKGTGRTMFKARALPTRQISYLTEGARAA